MAKQIILALTVLQIVSTSFWFMQVRKTNQRNATCELSRIVETEQTLRVLNEILPTVQNNYVMR